MKLVIASFLLSAAASAQTGNLGIFKAAADVGNPSTKGSTAYDASTGQYRITGAGANMWTNADQFQYLYREVTGNMTITATVQFVGEGAVAHRKAGIVIRKTLDTDS